MVTRYAWLLTVMRRDTTVIRITSATDEVTVGATTWEPAEGLKVGDRSIRNDGTVPSFQYEISAQSGSAIELADIDNGLYEEAAFLLEWTDANNPGTKEFAFYGSLGNADYDLRGAVTFEVLSQYAIPRDVFVRQYGIPCDADFGDPLRCKIPTFPYRFVDSDDLRDVERNETIAVGDRRRFRFDTDDTPEDYHNVYLECTAITTGITSGSAPTISDVVDDTSTDGGVTWTTRNAYARWARIDTIDSETTITLTALPDPRASDTTWFEPGRIVMRSGYMMNTVAKVTAWDADTNQITIAQPMGELLAVNDWLEIAPDCDKTLSMCVLKYDNALNYRGFPHLSGDKAATSTVIPGVTVLDGSGGDPVDDYEGEAVEFLGDDA